MRILRLAAIATVAMSTPLVASHTARHDKQQTLPRTAGGKPDLQGYLGRHPGSAGADLRDHRREPGTCRPDVRWWRVAAIPYQAWAAARRLRDYQHRQTEDPYEKCWLPGVPRVMTMDYPFQIFPDVEDGDDGFEWELEYRADLHRWLETMPLTRTSGWAIRRGHWGRRHAGCRRRQQQRQDLARHGGRLPQRRDTC